MAKNDFHDFLKKVPLFADLNKDELNLLEQAATSLDYPAGKVLMTEGSFAHEMFVIISGQVEVLRDGERVAEIGPGSFVGEMAMLTHSRRNSTVQTTTEAEVLHIDGRSFSNLLHEAPSIAVKMLPVVASRVVANADDHSH
jgi:CRP-like cAMP-binding protein